MNRYISILGLYSWDPTLFDQMELPEGIDKQTAINEILLRCADLEVIYPDADFMKEMIGHWSKVKAYSFQKMYDTTQLVYNPIWNKDGTIVEEAESANDGTNINSVKGFNSDSWSEALKSQSNAAGRGRTMRTEQGNIGVTTTQQMIREERDISDFSIYAYIADSFKDEFCILIY